MLPLPAVMVYVTIRVGVMLAPGDTDFGMSNSDLEWVECVTMLCIRVTTLAYIPGIFRDAVVP